MREIGERALIHLDSMKCRPRKACLPRVHDENPEDPWGPHTLTMAMAERCVHNAFATPSLLKSMLPYLEHFGNYTNPFQWAKVNPLTTQNQGLPRISRIASLVKKWGHTQVYANVDRESMGKWWSTVGFSALYPILKLSSSVLKAELGTASVGEHLSRQGVIPHHPHPLESVDDLLKIIYPDIHGYKLDFKSSASSMNPKDFLA